MSFLWGLILKSKAAKISVGAVGSSGLFALLLSYIGTKDDSLRSYVDNKHENAIIQIINLEKGQTQIIKGQDRVLYLIEKISDRMDRIVEKQNK